MSNFDHNTEENEFENYLSNKELEELKNKLIELKSQLEAKTADTTTSLKDSSDNDPDPYSRSITELNLDLKAQDADLHAKMLNEVNLALSKIKLGTYGYCEITGEPIGFKRLKAMPYTKFCLAVQEEIESSNNQKTE